MNALFDTPIDRAGNYGGKWLSMAADGIPVSEGLAMSTADSDYPTAPCVIEALRGAVEHGAFGYGGPRQEFLDAVVWWMKTRHNWEVDPAWILPTQGLGHAIATTILLWTEPGDPVAFFTPVYHEFAMKSKRAGRSTTELPMRLVDGRYELDLEDAQSRLTGKEKLLLWCSPQNPSGRVWTPEELRAVAEFAARNDMTLVSDEVHHDLVFPGQSFVPMDVVAPDHRDRTITLVAASKTFNIAGLRTGMMVIPDPDLRARVKKNLVEMNYDTGILGRLATMAAYSPDGAAWVDQQMLHLARNCETFDGLVNSIPGARSLTLEATYLAWVDFTDTGMTAAELDARIKGQAKIVCQPGGAFGKGNESFARFNLAMPHSQVQDAAERLQRAFADLQ